MMKLPGYDKAAGLATCSFTSTEHHARVNIDAPPHSEVCYLF